MLQTTHAERQYNAAAASRAHDERKAALAVNDILNVQEAFVLACIMDTFTEAAPALIEAIFEQHGWPADQVDEAYLAGPGIIVWRAFQTYRGRA